MTMPMQTDTACQALKLRRGAADALSFGELKGRGNA
jgi:hypothetical protein